MESFDAVYTEEEAAQAIQAIHRGSLARKETRKLAAGGSYTIDDSEPSVAFTREKAREMAIATGCGSSANGMLVVCPRLVASGHRLAGNLSTALGGMPHLTALDLSDNHLHSLDGLEALPVLHTLACRRNRLLSALDYRAPPKGSRLREADLRNNAIAGAVSLPPDERGRPVGVDAHPWLETLLIDGNRLRSLRGIGVARRLRIFSAACNALQDTAGLMGLRELRELDLSANRLCRCAELSSLWALRTLALHENRITALPDLSRLLKLHTLSLAHNLLGKDGAPMAALAAAAEAIAGATLKQEMDTDGDGFIDSTELAAWEHSEGLRRNKSLRTLRLLEGHPALAELPDVRLRVIHLLPTVSLLDGVEATAEEVVAATGLYGVDTQRLTAIREPLFPELYADPTEPDQTGPNETKSNRTQPNRTKPNQTKPNPVRRYKLNTFQRKELIDLQHLYQIQHTAAWQRKQPEAVSYVSGSGWKDIVGDEATERL